EPACAAAADETTGQTSPQPSPSQGEGVAAFPPLTKGRARVGFDPFSDFADLVAQRRQEADDYYATLIPPTLGEDLPMIVRQAMAYEWKFNAVNPPVSAWAAWRIYSMERKQTGSGDRFFLERVFHKLLINFTWWVNRKDDEGNNVFQGGFLGLDNIGVFDRS